MDLIKSLLSYGTAPALLVIAFTLFLVVRRLTANEAKGERRDESQRKRDEAIKDDLSKQRELFEARMKEQLDEVRASGNEQLLAMERRNLDEHREQQAGLSGLTERVNYLEKDYLPREEHYRDLSGWRGEIADVRKEVHAVLLAVKGRGKG